MSKVPAVDQNRYHLSIANLAQFRAKLGIGKFFLFVFGQKTKSQLELRYGPVARYWSPVRRDNIVRGCTKFSTNLVPKRSAGKIYLSITPSTRVSGNSIP